MEEKLFGRTCPRCGEIYQIVDFAKVGLAAGVNANMQCPNGHKWTEFYSLSYQGFWWDGKHYDEYGKGRENN